MKKTRGFILLLLSFLLVFSVALTACGSNKETSSPGATSSSDNSGSPAGSDAQKSFVKGADMQALAPAGVKLMVLPADVVAEKQIRIATIMVQNNPFGMAVKEGTDFAKEVLKDRNVKVDWISVPDFDAKKFEEAIQNTITAQYDAITLFGVSEALQPAVDRAVDEGMLVYTFNTEPGDHSKRQAYWGQDGYAGGQKIATALAESMNFEGEYAIITGSFSVLGHELRRKGARDVLDKHPKLKLVGEFENQDKSEEAYNITQNLLTSNPNLKGIYVTAGGPFGAAKALKDAGLAPGQIKLVAHDWLDETISYVREGYITAVLDQDPFNQGYAPVVAAFNKLAAGIDPEQEINWIEGDIATPENVNEKVPE